MKGLNCPYCNKQVLRVWRLFIFPYLFFVGQRCMNCQNQVKINWQVLLNVLVAIAIAALIGILIDKIYSFDSILFDVAFYLFAVYVPFLLGQKLFLKDEKD